MSRFQQSKLYSTIFSKQKRLKNKTFSGKNSSYSRETDYLKNLVGETLVDRLSFIKKPFPRIVDYLSGAGHLHKHLESTDTEKVLMYDSCRELLYRDVDQDCKINIERKVLDDDEVLPFSKESQEIIMSNLGLHWINDLVGVFKQINTSLVEDGLFLGSMLGEDTLFELRTSLQQAELERSNGISPRISPFAKSNDIANILQRTGFSLVTVDVEQYSIQYPSMFELIQDLRLMGENTALENSARNLNKQTILAAASIYNQVHGKDGKIPATFEVIYMIGWKPSSTQQKPLKRGSAKKSLKDVLE